MDRHGDLQEMMTQLSEQRISRRSLVGRAAVLGLSAPAIATLLAACATDDDDDVPTVEPIDEDDDEEEVEVDDDEPAVEPDDDEDDDDVGVGPADGELIAGLSERSLTLDPADHYSISSTSVLKHIFDPLVEVTDASELNPALAESWEAEDDTTWRFVLREGVTFHDGTPFDASSVVTTLERVRDNTQLIKSFVYQTLDSIEADGDYEVVVTTTTPFAPLIGHLTMLGMLHPMVADDPEGYFESPVGTGPFRFVSWVRGEEITLEANDDYWQEGIPRAQTINFRFIPELSTRVSGLRAGEIDVIDRVTPDIVETIQETEGVQALDVPAIEAAQWVFQMEREPVNDPELRKAISLGIDRDVIINDFMLGYASPTVCPVPPPLIGHVDLGVKPYDPETARQMIQDGGYDGVTIDFVLMRGLYPMQLEIAQAVQAMLSEIGVDVNIRDMEIASARDARSAGDYHLFYSGWTHMPHDPDWYFGQWFTADGAAGLSRYNNPEVEELIIAARASDPEVRQQSYEEIQRILWEEEPTIWPFYSVAMYGVNDRVQNFEPRSDYYVLLSNVSVS